MAAGVWAEAMGMSAAPSPSTMTVCHCSPLARWKVVSTTRSRSAGSAQGATSSSSRSWPRRAPSARRSDAGPRSAPAIMLGTRAASMAACTPTSCALVRVSTAMLDQDRPGVRDSLARCAAQVASSSLLACDTTLGTGPSTRVVRGATTSPAPPKAPPSRSTAVATATTCGVQRWFSSRRITEVPGRISGSRSSRVGSAPLKP